jgi:hypothetical protein
MGYIDVEKLDEVKDEDIVISSTVVNLPQHHHFHLLTTLGEGGWNVTAFSRKIHLSSEEEAEIEEKMGFHEWTSKGMISKETLKNYIGRPVRDIRKNLWLEESAQLRRQDRFLDWDSDGNIIFL